jgi:hypothetical protein
MPTSNDLLFAPPLLNKTPFIHSNNLNRNPENCKLSVPLSREMSTKLYLFARLPVGSVIA